MKTGTASPQKETNLPSAELLGALVGTGVGGRVGRRVSSTVPGDGALETLGALDGSKLIVGT